MEALDEKASGLRDKENDIEDIAHHVGRFERSVRRQHW